MSSLLLIVLSAVLVCHYAPSVMGQRAFENGDVFRHAAGIAVASFLTLAVVAPASYLIEHWLLTPFDLRYLRTFVLIAAVIILVRPVGWLMPRWGWTPAYPSFTRLMTANCLVLGTALLTARSTSLAEAFVLGIACSLAFGALLLTFTTLHQRVLQADVPLSFRDAPIALISVGLMAVALMGLIGLVRD
ncbi:MAG TPA: Rnf-Nqr domain containing protein [Povalibacter sp.]